MKRNALICLLISIMLFSIETVYAAKKNIREEYPLSNQQVIINYSKPVVEMFEQCRSMLIDSYTNIADKLSTNSTSTLISAQVTANIGKKQHIRAYMEYSVILEFKENRARLTFSNVLIHTFNGYGQHFVNKPNEMGKWFNRTWKEASIDFIGDYNRIYNKVKAIADGNYESDW